MVGGQLWSPVTDPWEEVQELGMDSTLLEHIWSLLLGLLTFARQAGAPPGEGACSHLYPLREAPSPPPPPVSEGNTFPHFRISNGGSSHREHERPPPNSREQSRCIVDQYKPTVVTSDQCGRKALVTRPAETLSEPFCLNEMQSKLIAAEAGRCNLAHNIQSH